MSTSSRANLASGVARRSASIVWNCHRLGRPVSWSKWASSWLRRCASAWAMAMAQRWTQVSTNLRTDLALDALEMGLWNRQRAGQDVTGLVHHSDRGVQYRAIRYAERLAEAEAVASVGSKGDSYDCEQNQGLPGRGLTLAYDWPVCLGVDLSTPARWRSTHTPAGREGGDRIGA